MPLLFFIAQTGGAPITNLQGIEGRSQVYLNPQLLTTELIRNQGFTEANVSKPLTVISQVSYSQAFGPSHGFTETNPTIFS